MSATRLTPSLKQLLALRGPQPLPSPPLPQLNAIFSKTLRDAQHRRAETGWLVLTICSLLTVNRPSAVGHLYRFVTRDSLLEGSAARTIDVPSAVNKAALMRESALKSVIFVGVPRVIQSLAALHEALDDEVKQALRTSSRRTASMENIDSILSQGRALWDSVYTPHADKLHAKLGSYHPDFIAFIIQCYGSVLSPLAGGTKSYADRSGLGDSDQGNLSRALGSVVGMATLRAEGGVGPQLVSHTFGLLKARNTPGQSAEDQWLSSDEGAEWVLRTVDEILEGVSAKEGEVKARL
ncbi:hypothetical protein CC1G_01252 [Coprinopsis cinerea okayama7|uniref:Uncharacterized protein n=1 Tax=Coprinopsis cinerea (strain Okayama-7 / 130 / ATCC MYA-4618 / FGSC 9003) TaxID=240176 RepID=A8NY45_COPC7|nr:hypothetical protein CC1G_01252 [Coprinopsis cinerea okayama7\|eukprot:XP_001837340.2 hypothetical protein CC1G_01252 [Coprinopsis cinerea okayama7\